MRVVVALKLFFESYQVQVIPIFNSQTRMEKNAVILVFQNVIVR